MNISDITSYFLFITVIISYYRNRITLYYLFIISGSRTAPEAPEPDSHDRYSQIDPLFDEIPGRIRGSGEPHDHDEDIGSHDGKDEPDAHPEPDPLGEEEGRPQEPDQADEPEKKPCSQGARGNHPTEKDGNSMLFNLLDFRESPALGAGSLRVSRDEISGDEILDRHGSSPGIAYLRDIL